MEPECTATYEFNSLCYGNPIYNVFVALLFKRTLLLGAGLLLLFVLAIAVCLWLIPGPHSPLHYMVAGSVATAIALVAAFGILNRMPGHNKPVVRIRIARRSGQTP